MLSLFPHSKKCRCYQYIMLLCFIYRWMYNKHISLEKSIYYFSRYAAIKARTGSVYGAKLKLYVHVLPHRTVLRNGCNITFSHLFLAQNSPPFPLIYLSPFACVILDARFAQTHACETYSRVLQIPNARRMIVSISLSLSLSSPSLLLAHARIQRRAFTRVT